MPNQEDICNYVGFVVRFIQTVRLAMQAVRGVHVC
jgi:hypothetical protein